MEYRAHPAPEEGGGEALSAPKARFFNARNIAYLGVLMAVEIVLLLWGSAIPVGGGGASLNFSLVPIVLGAIVLGPLAGTLLGAAAGVAIFVMVIVGAQGPVFSYLFAAQPVVIALVCIVKTTAAGLVSGWLYRLIAAKSRRGAVFAAAAAAPVVNTGLFILGLLCMSGDVMAAAEEFALGQSSAITVIVLVFVTYNFFIELAIDLVLAPALCTVIRVAEKQVAKRKKRA